MTLGPVLLKQLQKTFAPDTMVTFRFKAYDIAVRTDAAGHAVQAFIGKADATGRIRGDRYARTLKYDREGVLIKDHWERKGKAV